MKILYMCMLRQEHEFYVKYQENKRNFGIIIIYGYMVITLLGNIWQKILVREAGKQLVIYRQKLDKIKLKRNQLNQLLKLKYNLSKQIDDYNKYIRDEIWEKTDKRLQEIFKENSEIVSKAKNNYFISIQSYIQYAKDAKKKIDKDIAILCIEYDDKREILQNLANFKNNKHGLFLNIAMLFVSTVTLAFVIFPGRAEQLAELIRKIYNWILQFIP